jgi:hypothetical protein
MAGIRITAGDHTALHSVVWVDPEDTPVSYIVIKDGTMGIATPDYIAGELFDIATGDRTLAESWDILMVKTTKNALPEVCRVRMIGNDGGAEILVGSLIVHRFA